MANDLNVVALVGRLVREAEVRYSNSGSAMVRFSIAVNRSRKMADGSWSDEASYFDCLYAGKSAENVSQYLERGRQVAVQGELRQNRWTDQEGQTRSRVEIFVNSLSLLGGSGRETASAPMQRSAQPSYSQSNSRVEERNIPKAPLSDGPEDFQDDDIPF